MNSLTCVQRGEVPWSEHTRAELKEESESQFEIVTPRNVFKLEDPGKQAKVTALDTCSWVIHWQLQLNTVVVVVCLPLIVSDFGLGKNCVLH